MKEKDPFKKYINCTHEISNKKQLVVERQHEIVVLKKEIDVLELERRDYGLEIYNKQKRKKLIKKGYKAGYSEEKLKELEIINNSWNQDNVSAENIEEFMLLDKYISKHSKGNSDFFWSFGAFFESDDFDDEEDIKNNKIGGDKKWLLLSHHQKQKHITI